ncbi:hypothetical protein DJ568_09430 [Mucilaginibacter hurinus]|uniref:Glycosyltransferase subfamily 4-like N-terminal domain-containing protein n=1 Tax=Mucilaginibacter hurinus TaxID=2201324 RepID=A0A367GMK5_9SPHI|nr:glycosyltransferase family 4 protein [Mucilaginibacter hurinus]RCH54704.1 hypothetical protein DJ568_09430 [Mucilaginibacter hurinus]
MKKKILFVSHDASRTGAPLVLKHLMHWLKDHADFEFSILIKDGGETDIEKDFATLAPVYKWAPGTPGSTWPQRAISKLSSRLFDKPIYKSYPRQLRSQNFDLIYLNTVASTELLPYLKEQHNCPVILHVHENEYSIKTYYPESLTADYLQLINHYIVVSESTGSNLAENFGIPAEKISLVNAFVPVKEIKMPGKKAGLVKSELGIHDDFIVGGCGVTSWRKGVDIFIQLALLIKKAPHGKKIRFVWIGHLEYFFKNQLAYELKRLGLTHDDIIFTGSVTNPQDYFQIFDVFALTSREDPFPLVCLEAAALAKPVIYFENAGGVTEMFKKGGGIAVPYGDTQAMANAIISMQTNTAHLLALGLQAQNNVQQYDVDVQAPLIAAVVDKNSRR